MRQTLFHLPYLGIPVYGFGLMLFVGFLSATWYSKKKAADEGENPKTIEDIALLVLVSGVLGARAFFVIQYNNEFLPSPKLSTIAALIAAMVSIVVLIVGNAFLWRKNKTSAAHVLLPALAAVSIWGCFQEGFPSLISFWMAILIPVTVFGLWVRIVWNAPDKFENVKVAGVSITSCFILLMVLQIINSWTDGRLRQSVFRTRTETRQADFKGGILNIEQGGLVWYGGVAGSAVAFLIFSRKRNIQALRFSDIIAPSILLGLACGRVGCFLNGCCYGAVVEEGNSIPWAVEFPRGSVPYHRQLQLGQISENAGSSLPVHPTQLYSSLNALLIFGLLSAYFPFRRSDGAVVALGMLLYAPSRFFLEYLRSDELAVGGTGMSISQNVSLLVFAAGAVWMIWIFRNKTTKIGLWDHD